MTGLPNKIDSRQTLFASALALGALSCEVARGHLAGIDHAIAHWVATMRSPALDGLIHAITFFGSRTWLVIGSLGLAIVMLRRGGLRSVGMLAATFAVGSLLEIALRLSVSQWRPDTVPIPATMEVITRFDLAGFPSGHAFRSALIFGWIIRELNRGKTAYRYLGTILCVLAIALVGFSRLYLNRHWASDVLGSWLIALVVLSIARVWEATVKPSIVHRSVRSP